ncbi:MAG: hypothetical protein ACKO6B_09390 [Planctomycetia bacterium]
MKRIPLDYGADEPLLLEVHDDALVADCRGPDGVTGAAAGRLVTAAIGDPQEGPPIESHVVPGDRLTIGLTGDVPQAAEVIRAVTERLIAAGAAPADITVLHGPSFEGSLLSGRGGSPAEGMVEFDPADDLQTSYVAADEAGRPIHLARALVDADVVVAIGGCGWDAAFGGRSLEGELWPTFSRRSCREDLVRSLASRGRLAVEAWKTSNHEAIWQLGVCANLRIVGGRGDSLAAAAFGLPDTAAREARKLAAGWRPRVPGPALLSITSLSHPSGGTAMLLRAVAAAARVTHPGGTICVASRLAEAPGVIFSRWREGAPLDGLVREALATRDQALITDAYQTRFFARALGDRRLVLLSCLDEATVEELELGFAATPEVVERLAHRAESVIVLHEADRMLPRVTSG